MASVNPNPAETTPIEPMIELALAYISFAASAIQYPPEAATSSQNTKTGLSFSSARSRIRFWIRSAWTGDPPGELMISATADAFF